MTSQNAYALDNKILTQAETEAKAKVESDPTYRTKTAEEKKRIYEETLRSLTISKTQALLDQMQMQVDHKLDAALEIAFGKTEDRLIDQNQKVEIRKLFKVELYRYMYGNRSTEMEVMYQSAR